MERFDHIFIGSRINSPVAAALLAGKGERVLVRGRREATGRHPTGRALWAPRVLHCGLTPESIHPGPGLGGGSGFNLARRMGA